MKIIFPLLSSFHQKKKREQRKMLELLFHFNPCKKLFYFSWHSVNDQKDFNKATIWINIFSKVKFEPQKNTLQMQHSAETQNKQLHFVLTCHHLI